MTERQKIAVVIPVFNEEKHLDGLIEKICDRTDLAIVVDDGSWDATPTIINKWVAASKKVYGLRHCLNLGKGAALKTGCEAAADLGADVIITIDGDGQHPPHLIEPLLSYFNKKKLDIVFSCRQGGDKMPLIRKLGNKAFNLVSHYMFNLKVKDIGCGLRAFKAEHLNSIMWNQRGYSGEIQMALKAAKNKLNYGEFLIPTIYNDNFKGVHMLHGLKTLCQMLIWRLTL